MRNFDVDSKITDIAVFVLVNEVFIPSLQYITRFLLVMWQEKLLILEKYFGFMDSRLSLLLMNINFGSLSSYVHK